MIVTWDGQTLATDRIMLATEGGHRNARQPNMFCATVGSLDYGEFVLKPPFVFALTETTDEMPMRIIEELYSRSAIPVKLDIKGILLIEGVPFELVKIPKRKDYILRDLSSIKKCALGYNEDVAMQALYYYGCNAIESVKAALWRKINLPYSIDATRWDGVQAIKKSKAPLLYITNNLKVKESVNVEESAIEVTYSTQWGMQ